MPRTISPDGVTTLTPDSITPGRRITARALLDRSKAQAQQESADGQFFVQVPAFEDPETGAPFQITMRRLSYAQVSDAINETMEGGKVHLVAATRRMLYASFVFPVFTAGEIDELLDDPDQYTTASLLSQAVNRINKTAVEDQIQTIGTFRGDAEV